MTPAPTPNPNDLASRVGSVASPSQGSKSTSGDLAARVANVAANGVGSLEGKPSGEQDESNTRQMLVAGLTGMPTPNMTDADRASFEQGKAAGAASVPLVAGATIGASQIATALSAAVPSTTQHVQAVGAWALKNPLQAYLLLKVLQETVPGLKKIAGIVEGAPDQ